MYRIEVQSSNGTVVACHPERLDYMLANGWKVKINKPDVKSKPKKGK